MSVKYIDPKTKSHEIERLRASGFQVVFTFEPEVDKIVLSSCRRKAVMHYANGERRQLTESNGFIVEALLNYLKGA